jgi:hypothetical protein
VRLVNARRVPPALQESLLSGVNALVADQPTCLPDVPAATTTPKQPRPRQQPQPPPARIRIPIPPGPGRGRHGGPAIGPGRGHGPHGGPGDGR